ncbi:sulfurtransferase [Fischerella thermalis]|jgi:thiosulfate/3-mercaptopyruvate sulfurtransferase|uniref:3-mercaptopyruvate sulfurtransferase n=2 Tax=Fischerella TaxID=1190 RepID=G6FN55_9CYAN|nr:sulfurtransferase [Fischerella thermalis]PMB05102.1 sulfurtransferase [Fischerella thermalis CCMEE 5328]EHC19485.1 3-mercaptopyruvate sulfurtransferase [Fischerella thermalis JSC-11]MBF1987748.1 sulfurtransferase [Fischerella thermalis M58_A2018_009]MBF2061868.1 sulfurtransferase [Fischerella thermalis M66_A2018_004]PLZ05933.1 sulfurtransferase [Fischerella thermalis WC114]
MFNIIVSCEWLLEHLEDPQVVIVDCRFSLAEPQLGRQQYQTSHIKGAYYLDLNQDLSSPVAEYGGRHPLPHPDELAHKLSTIGVKSQKTLVVAYDDSRLAFASRLWWLLRYLGHEPVAVLNGGFSEWQKAGYPVTDTIPQPEQKGNFTYAIQTQMVADRQMVISRKDLPGVVLVDSRESDRYLGIREPIDKIAGHIPGAVNYPWQEVTDTRGYVLPPSEQRHRWSQLEQAEEIIVYCGSGVTACVNLLSLELAGIPTGKLYAGSWSDWISYY